MATETIEAVDHKLFVAGERLETGEWSEVRSPYDGTVIEVFEWRSSEAVDSAHANPAVRALWSEFDAACDYLPIGVVPEAQRMFSEFDALPL